MPKYNTLQLAKKDDLVELNRILRELQSRINDLAGGSGEVVIDAGIAIRDELRFFEKRQTDTISVGYYQGKIFYQKVGTAPETQFQAVENTILPSGGTLRRNLLLIQRAAQDAVDVGKASTFNFTTGLTASLDLDNDRVDVGLDDRWDDLRVEPVARTTGANAPTFEKWKDNGAGSRGVYLYSFDDAAAGSEKEVFFTIQMPHNWKVGTSIHVHVHWIGAVNDTTATPQWGLEYTWKDIGQVFGNTQIVYKAENIDGSGSTDPNVTAFKHYLTEFDEITPDATQDGVSSVLIGRIFRNSANAADTYNAGGAKCGLLYIDAHYQVDSLGSRTEYVK